MKVVIVLVIIVIVVLVGIWIYGFNEANDLKVDSKNISEYKDIKKVLIIFPHPDDEANSLSGTITQFVKYKIPVDWVILSKGERGTSDASLDENLKEVRSKEAEKVSHILGVNKLVVKDYPDNGISEFKDKLFNDLKNIIFESNPDLIITYDESGGYGHPDHIIVSQVVTNLVKNDFKNISLWYTSTPEKLFKKLSLPEQMATDANFKSSRKSPNFKIWVGLDGLANKIKAVYTYQSQFNSFVKSVPIKQIPMWFYVSLTPYEYFYEVE